MRFTAKSTTMGKFKLKEGINICTNSEYHGDKSYFSSSNLKLLLKNPEKFKHEIVDGSKPEEKQVNAFDEGNYAHTLILEPENVEAEYAFFTGFRKAGADWESFKAANSDKIILSKPQKHRVEKWVEAYKALPAAVSLVKGGESEYSLAGQLYDIPIKVRADYINIESGYIADVKTTSYNTDIDSFKYVIDSLRYDLSAALYCKMFENYYGKKFDFYFIVLGKRDNLCQVYRMSEATMRKGDLMVLEAINKFKKCAESNIWTIRS